MKVNKFLADITNLNYRIVGFKELKQAFSTSLLIVYRSSHANLKNKDWLILWASRLKLEILIREEFCVTSCLFVKVSPIASFVAVR